MAKTGAKKAASTSTKKAASTTKKSTKKTINKEELHVVSPEELMDDGELLCQFEIPGRPATKKTHQQVIYVKGHPRVIPSSQYSAYEKVCKQYCEDAWKNIGKQPMDFGMSIKAKIYLNTWSVGDHVGYLQALGDILEKYEVIANDKWIHWTDGDEHWFGGVDKDNPRVELEIRRYRHPYESYRDTKEEGIKKKAAKQKAKDDQNNIKSAKSVK